MANVNIHGKIESLSKEVGDIKKTHTEIYKKHYVAHKMFFIELTKNLQNTLKREKHEAEEIMYKFVNENVSEEATVLTGSKGGEHPDMHI